VDLEDLEELARVVVSENSLCKGRVVRMCSVLLDLEKTLGLERREGRESGNMLERGAPVEFLSDLTTRQIAQGK
jgi:hypothetical protein